MPPPAAAAVKPAPVQAAVPPLISSPKQAQSVLGSPSTTPTQGAKTAVTPNQIITPKVVTPIIKGKYVNVYINSFDLICIKHNV